MHFPAELIGACPLPRVHTYDILHNHSSHPVAQSASPSSAADDSFLRLACPVVPHAWPVVCDMHWRGTGQNEHPANIKVGSTAGPPQLFTSCRPTLSSLSPGSTLPFQDIGPRGLTFRTPRARSTTTALPHANISSPQGSPVPGGYYTAVHLANACLISI